jgi:hypothetical protein
MGNMGQRGVYRIEYTGGPDYVCVRLGLGGLVLLFFFFFSSARSMGQASVGIRMGADFGRTARALRL